jgi:tetratricopeptide (TPR) repeat protein
MIVKNESEIIVESLKKLTNQLTFHYWVICDTGSTDDTKKLIRSFFKARKIPGELIDSPWVDFGTNRTIALSHAYKKCDYLLIWDADDEIRGSFVLPSRLTSDSYSLNFANDETRLIYRRPVLINNHKKWRFTGVLHEYLESSDADADERAVHIVGEYAVQSGRAGSRNKDPLKYVKDAAILEKAMLATEVGLPLYGRYAFYCGNSYFNAKMYAESIPFYEKVLGSVTWIQEKYVSCLRIYEAYDQLKVGEKGLPFLERGHEMDPFRAECIFRLIKYYCVTNQFATCLSLYAKIADYYEHKYLSDNTQRLFVYSTDYSYFLPYFMIIVSENTKRHDLGLKMYEMIFRKQEVGVDLWFMNHLFHNIQFFVDCFGMKDDMYKFEFVQLMLKYIQTLYDVRKYSIESRSIPNIQKYLNFCLPYIAKENPLIRFDVKKNSGKDREGTILTIRLKGIGSGYGSGSDAGFDLFKQTMYSILNTWLDFQLIDAIYCVYDDPIDSCFAELFPFIQFVKQGGDGTLIQLLKMCKPAYWIHIENPCLFFRQCSYVTDSKARLKLGGRSSAIWLLNHCSGKTLDKLFYEQNDLTLAHKLDNPFIVRLDSFDMYSLSNFQDMISQHENKKYVLGSFHCLNGFAL